MAKTPRRAAAAMTDVGEHVDGILVRPITLGIMAVLEKIDSPLARKCDYKKLTVRDMLPTIFVMTRSASISEELLAEGGFDALMEEAVRWADNLAPASGSAFSSACLRAALRVADLLPQGVPSGEDAPSGNGNAAGMAG